MIYKKILKEMGRYVRMRMPGNSPDEYDEFLPRDEISLNGMIVELYPIAHGNLGYPGMDISFYRKCKKGEDSGLPGMFFENALVRYIGFISIVMDLRRKNIIHADGDWRGRTPYTRMYECSNGSVMFYPERYSDVNFRSRIVLCLDGVFGENGGRKENLNDFYKKLTLLNIGFV